VRRVTVTRSTVLNTPIGTAWALLRDFNGQSRWQPGVAESRTDDDAPGDLVGAVRTLRLADGAVLREQLLALSDREHTARWCILDAPLPLHGYVCTLSLKPITDGDRTLWHWNAAFSAPDAQADALAALIGEGVFETAMAHVGRLLARGPAAIAAPLVGGDTADGIVVSRHGGPEVLVPGRVAVPPPGPGQVTLRHTAIGVNFIDVYCRTGYFDLMPIPGTPGMEAAGVIEVLGTDVAGFAPGDRVAYACPPTGAYATRRTIDAGLLVPLPADIPDEVAAASLLKGMTAEFLLHEIARIRPGDAVLVHAAAGGVGSFLAPWAAHLGATVIGTVGSAEKARIALRDHACAHAVLLSDPDWPAKVKTLTGGRGVSVAFDAIGKPTFWGSVAALAVRGHLVSFGQAGGDLGAVEVARLAGSSLTLSRPNYGHYMGTAADVRRASARLFDVLRRGIVRGAPARSFPLREAAAAHRALESRATTGATVLIP
jgi:NADPH:quinone reductase-like Zn-dependent oxidoreductase